MNERVHAMLRKSLHRYDYFISRFEIFVQEFIMNPLPVHTRVQMSGEKGGGQQQKLDIVNLGEKLL